MARPIWTGSISFGLVNIPVKLFSAVRRKNVRFNQIDSRTGSRIKQKRVSAADGSEVDYEDIVKGFELPGGDYVTVTEDELAALDPDAVKTIDLEEFIELVDIDPVFYDTAYYLAPSPDAQKPYKLLVSAMEESGRVGIARFVMRTKQYLAAIRPVRRLRPRRRPEAMPEPEAVRTEVGGRPLKLTNLSKVLYPMVGFTKAQVIEYYARIAPTMLPHVERRGITFKRWPDGVTAEPFFNKRCPGHRPDWLGTCTGPGDKGRGIDYCTLNEPAALVWAANLAALEIHAPMARCADIESPTMVVFDLDPGEPATIEECAQVALLIRDVLETVGLDVWAKTSGSKGMQLYVPLNTDGLHADFVGRGQRRRRWRAAGLRIPRRARPGRRVRRPLRLHRNPRAGTPGASWLTPISPEATSPTKNSPSTSAPRPARRRNAAAFRCGLGSPGCSWRSP